MITDCVQVTTTVANKETAMSIAKELVEKNLAACVQVIGQTESFYRWQGEVEQSSEWLCVAKTTADKFSQIESHIQKIHPYDLPEIIATPISSGNEAYLSWVRMNVS